MFIRETLLDFDLNRLMGDSTGRSRGVHLSDIIGDIMEQLEPDRFGGPMTVEFVAVGLAWEQFLERFIPGSRPGEFVCDGIAMSPDWIHADGMLEEWKVAWVSSREGLSHPKLSRYHMQGKAYARVLGTDTVRFRMLWINGNYQPPVPDFGTLYEVTYTPLELAENWDLIRQHARDIGLL